MFRHPAWAAGGYCTGPPATRTVGTESMGGFDPPHGSPCTPTNQTSVQREDDEGDGAAASSVRQCQGPFHTFPPSFPPSSASVRPPLGACAAYLQGLAKVDAPGSVKFVPAVAYYFCLNSIHATWIIYFSRSLYIPWRSGARFLGPKNCLGHVSRRAAFCMLSVCWQCLHLFGRLLPQLISFLSSMLCS